MSELTDNARQKIAEIASRYGLSQQSVEQMAQAVSIGGGSMAQFNIQELGGNGQWMAGGMTMVGDMFNYGLQSTVSNLCVELSNAMANESFFKRPQTIAGSSWWPEELGSPSSVGRQNQARYAYFPQAHRIAFDPGNGQAVILLDTLDHQIGGFSQQQSGPGDPFAGVTFSSQSGQYALSSLPRVQSAGGDTQSRSDNSFAPTSSPYQQQRHNHGSQQQSQGWQPQQNSGSQQQSQGWQPQQNSGSQQQSQSSQPQSSRPQSNWDSQQSQPAEPKVEAEAPRSKPGAAAVPTAPSTASAMDILAIIERLATLRDAGALTEEDYTKKKAELLGRL